MTLFHQLSKNLEILFTVTWSGYSVMSKLEISQVFGHGVKNCCPDLVL